MIRRTLGWSCLWIGLVLVGVTSAQVEVEAAKKDDGLIFGVISPQCLDLYMDKYDFTNIECFKLVVSKLLGYGIILGSMILKLPQILKIVNAKDVTGLNPTAFYMEVLVFTSSSVYNLLQNYPISAWGENVVILVQNIFLVVLLWQYSVPRVLFSTKLYLIAFFGAITFIMFTLPQELQWILVSAGIPMSILARIPQIITNFREGQTGQLALITLVLNFGGSVARTFTTLQETGDMYQLAGFAVSLVLNGALIFQVLYYWNATNRLLRKEK